MANQPSELNNTIEILNQLKSLDLESVEHDIVDHLIVQLSKHMAIVDFLPAGRVIIRSVSCSYLKDDPISIYPLKVEQLSFNPNFESCGFNRASWQGESVFYGSIATGNMQPYHTSSLEVLTDLRESENLMETETFVIGKWVVTKDIPIIHISGELKHNAVVASSRSDTLYKSLSQYPEHIIQLKMIDNYLCSEFVKEVPKNEKWKYKISAAYASFLKRDNWPGLMYPSLQSEGAGYNIALFPEMVNEYLTFERAALSTYYKREKSIGNEITMEALPEDGSLRWKETYSHKMHPYMKKWYLGQSDDSSFQKYISFKDL